MTGFDGRSSLVVGRRRVGYQTLINDVLAQHVLKESPQRMYGGMLLAMI